MRRVAAVLAAAVVATSCSTTDSGAVSIADLSRKIQSSEAEASAVYLWAPWNRPSLELAKSFSELAVEYEPLGLRPYSICIGETGACQAALDGSFLTLREGFEDASEGLGFLELPDER